MTNGEYWDEIKDLAKETARRIEEGEDQNDVVHEIIDGHQWVIYTANHLDVLKYSDNEDHGITEGAIDANHEIREGGLSQLTQALAFWAMYADVNNAIPDVELEDEEDEESEKE